MNLPPPTPDELNQWIDQIDQMYNYMHGYPGNYARDMCDTLFNLTLSLARLRDLTPHGRNALLNGPTNQHDAQIVAMMEEAQRKESAKAVE
jgi:hypothetical protein